MHYDCDDMEMMEMMVHLQRQATDPVNEIDDPSLYCGILTTSIQVRERIHENFNISIIIGFQHVRTPLFVLVSLLDSTISRYVHCTLYCTLYSVHQILASKNRARDQEKTIMKYQGLKKTNVKKTIV